MVCHGGIDMNRFEQKNKRLSKCSFQLYNFASCYCGLYRHSTLVLSSTAVMLALAVSWKRFTFRLSDSCTNDAAENPVAVIVT